MTLYDHRPCRLGEGPLWLPERQTLIWFDILNRQMLARTHGRTQVWQFDRHHSAAGRVDEDTLILASEDALWRFDLQNGSRSKVCALEEGNRYTRSNDGRADPWGGFWIGTMGFNAERGAGAIYRYYRGECRQLVPDISISNAICFAPDRSCAYYTDTMTRRIMRLPLAADTGWPDGPPQVFADLRPAQLNPDGAVTDAAGHLWVACWGASCVICLDAKGTEAQRLSLPAQQPTCPAFGGPDLTDLFVTSAFDGLTEPNTNQGATFCIPNAGQGLAEPQVIL
ncbi:SMP-30/gluconolactonase/LRE family protein [Sulfitobacter sp. JB4-11]|uniref:SMP-30/gluconolactonase/LRE family protein n=1 Tax=Sulfitobacter rhodophyticola TaxID=3238304 RepID=UPI003D812C02